MNMAIFDDDLNDSLDDLLAPAKPGDPIRQRPTPPAHYVEQQQQTYFEKCRKCAGTGMTRWGVCFRCKGQKGKTFKTAPETRAAGRVARQKKQERQREERRQEVGEMIVAYQAQNPGVVEWLQKTTSRIAERGGNWAFPAELLNKLHQYGSLTTGQTEAVRKFMERDQQRNAERDQRAAAAPVVNITRIEEAFAHARGLGKKKLKLFLDVFTFKPAKANSRNAGAIYVTEGTVYLGKIAGGKFFRVRECSTEQEAKIIAACADPKAAAVAFGKYTGRCSCCGAELTDPNSIAAGIGPICAANYGF